MNKITTILAGVALAAAVAVPASAAPVATGSFGTAPSSTFPAFSFTPPGMSGYTLTGAPVKYTFGSNAPVFGTLNLVGTDLVAGSSYKYNNTTLTFNPTVGTGFTETGKSSVDITDGVYTFSARGGGFSGSGHSGDDLNLKYSPVPEASTVVSFGALLALGGLALLRRKSVARAS